MWEIDHAGQIYTFLYSILFGGGFSLLFTLFDTVRERLRLKGAALFLWDILYFFIIGFAGFCFLLARTNGMVRGYVWLGFAFGFFLFAKTVSRLFAKLLKGVFFIVKLVLLWLNRLIFTPLNRIFEKILNFFIKFFKKTYFFVKKGLKNKRCIVYTKEKCPQDGQGKDANL